VEIHNVPEDTYLCRYGPSYLDAIRALPFVVWAVCLQGPADLRPQDPQPQRLHQLVDPSRRDPAHLIRPEFCQVRSIEGPAERGPLVGLGDGGLRVEARRAVTLICAGWVPQDRGFVSEPAV